MVSQLLVLVPVVLTCPESEKGAISNTGKTWGVDFIAVTFTEGVKKTDILRSG